MNEQNPTSGWISYRGESERKPGSLSLSMAGHCRMELWLTAQCREPEPFTPSAERVFEYGDAIEELLFETREVASGYGLRTIGNWYRRSASIRDPESGILLIPGAALGADKLRDRQRVVEFAGFKGRIDALDDVELLLPDGTRVPQTILLDGKSANGRSFAGASTGSLLGNVFSREYVLSQTSYMAGLRAAGEKVEYAALIYADKEKGGLMTRLLKFDGGLASEAAERLAAGADTAEPMPDFGWVKGEYIPPRCGYCNMKFHCGTQRGQAISPAKMVKGRPVWEVIS